jgi:uncharacterized protein (DUF1015 family)
MASKPEIKILELLSNSFIVDYNLFTQHSKIIGHKFKLLVDFTLINSEGKPVYLEYSGMNYFRKYLKLVDITNHTPTFTIFDDENLEDRLEYFIQNINDPEKLRVESLNTINNRIKQFIDEVNLLNKC